MADVRSWLKDAAAGFGSCLEGVADDQWSSPTPDVEWDVRALVAHLVDEQLWAPPLLAGRTIEDIGDEIPPDPLGDDPVTAQRNATTAMVEALEDLDLDATVHLSFGDVPAQVVSTGAAHLLVPARDRAVVDRARPDVPRLAAALAQVGGQGCYLYCLDPVDPAAVAHARFFNPTVGIAEDPATGSAAGQLVSRLVALGVVPDGALVHVEQGHAVGRPSRIRVQVSGERVRIGGAAVIVAEGRLTV